MNNNKRFGLALLLATLLVILTGFVFVGTAGATPSDKVRICHATAADNNPYTSPEVNTSSVDEFNNLDANGHGDHTGPVWYAGISGAWGDIIPPFTGVFVIKGKGNEPDTTVTKNYPGLNWNSAGQAIWNNNCNPVIPPPTTPPPTSPPPTTAPPTTAPPTDPPTTAPPTTAPPTDPPTTAPPTTAPPTTAPPTSAPPTSQPPTTAPLVVTPTPEVTESEKSDFDKAMEEANKDVEPCTSCQTQEITELPKTGFDDVTPWILLLGALALLTGMALKRWADKR